jgi:hypothetical protein
LPSSSGPDRGKEKTGLLGANATKHLQGPPERHKKTLGLSASVNPRGSLDGQIYVCHLENTNVGITP